MEIFDIWDPECSMASQPGCGSNSSSSDRGNSQGGWSQMLNVEGWQNKTRFIWHKWGEMALDMTFLPWRLSFRLGKLAQKQNAKWNDKSRALVGSSFPQTVLHVCYPEKGTVRYASFPSHFTQRVLNCLARGDGCYTGHTFPWWHGCQGPVSLQEVGGGRNGKEQCFSSRTITLWKLWHWFANISFLLLPEAAISDTMVFLIQSWWNKATFNENVCK